MVGRWRCESWIPFGTYIEKAILLCWNSQMRPSVQSPKLTSFSKVNQNDIALFLPRHLVCRLKIGFFIFSAESQATTPARYSAIGPVVNPSKSSARPGRSLSTSAVGLEQLWTHLVPRVQTARFYHQLEGWEARQRAQLSALVGKTALLLFICLQPCGMPSEESQLIAPKDYRTT